MNKTEPKKHILGAFYTDELGEKKFQFFTHRHRWNYGTAQALRMTEEHVKYFNNNNHIQELTLPLGAEGFQFFEAAE
jgi:hypothetical protein